MVGLTKDLNQGISKNLGEMNTHTVEMRKGVEALLPKIDETSEPIRILTEEMKIGLGPEGPLANKIGGIEGLVKSDFGTP